MNKNSPIGHYLDHLTLGIIKLFQEGFPLKIIHAVAAHHGEPGPTRPETIEAMIIHVADYIDSKLNGDILRKARNICQEELKGPPEFNNISQVLDVFEKHKKYLIKRKTNLQNLYLQRLKFFKLLLTIVL
ncbi:MAG: HD domain-containing protein [Nitrososphaeria archaeon]|nr:HD domain-containing protein [Nitrososphaeria archaeon]